MVHPYRTPKPPEPASAQREPRDPLTTAYALSVHFVVWWAVLRLAVSLCGHDFEERVALMVVVMGAYWASVGGLRGLRAGSRRHAERDAQS